MAGDDIQGSSGRSDDAIRNGLNRNVENYTSNYVAIIPDKLNHNGNMTDNWIIFKQKFDIYLKASKFNPGKDKAN